MPIDPLLAISPIDGRYETRMQALQPIVSEYGLIKYRAHTEIHWLLFLTRKQIHPVSLSNAALQTLENIDHQFSLEHAQRIKQIEITTRHDVKAVEYFIKEQLESHEALRDLIPYIHFACTSEDINSTAYSLMLIHARDLLHNSTLDIISALDGMARQYAETPMLSRTHGQTASPTTLGKEIKNVIARLQKQSTVLQNIPVTAKFSGAVGNYNAHLSAYPAHDWPTLCEEFIQSLGIEYNHHTTQIEPHDHIAELFHCIMRINTILIDYCRDTWQYISLNYYSQKKQAGEIGSSTMPHKINPIDFENAEGNLGIANTLAQHLANKLPVSRLQRDLSDSTVLRNIGVIFAHSLLAHDSLKKGLSRLSVNTPAIAKDLNSRWEVLAEPIQTVLRKHGITDAYEQLKELTRGSQITESKIKDFIEHSNLPEEDKKRLLLMTPEDYIGLASTLATTETQ